MTITLLLLGYRTPSISPETFQTHLESHVALIQSLAGDAFPLSHRRSYIARTTIIPTPDDVPASISTSVRNATTPAVVILGQQSDFEFDSVAELTFEDQAALERFQARVKAPEAARVLREDEDRFSDRGRVCIVRLGEVRETRRGDFCGDEGL
ncbi:hypothetical protein BO71DRAFT_482719 [Aspergillus ellipticus CBS 707.79]|uniref:EthD domain-containing protein n=1 Tax=Aspergillus ellipticus CBS 707.79 TaxID=1448320 RepID=A0A319DEI1_9EURO|nr:hypothetical protein BO71DRAFT_482719 [Aspergillus ellipticus CBS 707.79]